MHIDVNNAFLSWSAIDLLNNGSKYDIRNSYAAIGGDVKARKGIVLAKSNPAKKQGVVTAETLYSAKKKCPALRIYEPNFKFYSQMSHNLFSLLRKYTPDIEVASIDECYLDYGKIKSIYGDEVEFAKKIQKEIFDTLGFTVNIGIANNKLCAKMASDFSKPNKIHTNFDYEIKNKMWPLDISELFGIGKRTVPKLNKLGIYTIYDLAHTTYDKLYPYFKNQSEYMITIANGIDNSEVISAPPEPKGIGAEITLPKDCDNKLELYNYLENIADDVSIRLNASKKYAYVVCVVLKDNTFKRYSHQKKLVNAICSSKEIYKVAKEVLNEIYDNRPIRLIGIRLDKLVDTLYHQESIFDSFDDIKKDNNLDKTLLSLKNKYGNNVISKAGLKSINYLKH